MSVSNALPFVLSRAAARIEVRITPSVLMVVVIGVHQAVDMDNDIFIAGVIDFRLTGSAPGFFRSRIIGIHADKVQFTQIFEFIALRVLDPAAEYKMQELFF